MCNTHALQTQTDRQTGGKVISILVKSLTTFSGVSSQEFATFV